MSISSLCGIVILSAGLGGLLSIGSEQNTETETETTTTTDISDLKRDYEWYSSVGASGALICSALIHISHMGRHAGHILPRFLRLGFRMTVGVFLIFLPLFDVNDSSLFIIGIIALAIVVVVSVENLKGRALKKRKWWGQLTAPLLQEFDGN
jgi:hypothetical protein